MRRTLASPILLLCATLLPAACAAAPTEPRELPLPAAVTELEEPIRFQPARSLVEAPAEVELQVAGGWQDIQIRYTLDGSEPGPGRGQVYRAPLRLERSTVLRAVLVLDQQALTSVQTHSYLMPERVPEQAPSQPDLPAVWGSYARQPVPADYGMDPRVTRQPERRAAILRSLRQLPSISVALPPDALFGPDRGIYSHPLARGRDWERRASVELLDPRGAEPGFQVGAGLRIHGNTSRYPDESAKHGFRLHFRGEHGVSELDYPLFGRADEPAYESLVLRSLLNDSVLVDPQKAQYVRDRWLRETERRMGLPAVRGRFVHLYLNGLYWGLYELTERPDEHFAAHRHGGQPEDYVVISDGLDEDPAPPRSAWQRVLTLAEAGLEDRSRYRQLASQVDLDAFIDHWIAGQYAARSHWPSGNWTVIASREPEGRVHFPAWDAEASLLDVNLDRSTSAAEGTPAQLYSRLRRNPDFQARFDARLRRHFGPGGALHVAPGDASWDPSQPGRNRPAARYARLAARVADAVVAESARWSDWTDPAARAHDRARDWVPARDFVLARFFAERRAVLLDQMRQRELYDPTPPEEG